MAIWDAALEHGSKGTRYTQALLCALSQPVFGDRRCPSRTVLVAIAALLKMLQLWNTSATVTVYLLMLIPSLINAIIDNYLHMVNSFFISSICNY